MLFSVGDAQVEFSIQSVSKPFVFALVCEVIGYDRAQEKLGVNSTGLPFNSVMAIELSEDRTLNPMVNAGAIATTSLVPGATAEDRFFGSPPLAFTFGLGGLLMFPLSVGASMVLIERTSPDSLPATIERHRISVCFTAPTSYRAIALALQCAPARVRRAISNSIAGMHA